jgi:endonuclease G
MKKMLCSLVLLLFTDITFPQDFDYLPHSKNSVKIHHTGFALSYIEKYEEPEWVAYKLSRDMLKGDIERSNRFLIDPAVPSGSASPKDYVKSGYDKGHLCPAADMKSSSILMKECFYMSNMAPQEPSFNRGIWSRLEKLVRLWAEQDSLIYIVTGPIFKEGMQFIGNVNRVAVPKGFYKVILEYRNGHKPKAIGFVLKNEGSNEPLGKFTVTVDSVESITGIDFFPHLPDKLETKIESSADPREWDLDVVVSKNYEN